MNGARLWVESAALQFQPGELAKILLIVFLAGYLREKREVLAQGRLKDFGPLLVIWGAAMLVLVETNDLGSALLYFGIFLAMLYVATARGAVVAVGLGLFVGGAAVALPRACRASRSASRSGSTPWPDAHDQGYQTCSPSIRSRRRLRRQGLGTGVHDHDGQHVIPYLNTDFIYSALAQELGLVGAAALLLVYMVFCLRGFRVALLAAGRLLEAARRRPHFRLRAADVHHRRRRAAADPADRDHAALRLLRRVEHRRELHPARGAAARLQPRELGEPMEGAP